ncbi:MAG TPA: SRPBCC family protein [Steroidobacteraceae bacterium]|nr:SRPBCC family protein [Steroidobacteraceae bacterium]
MATDSTGMTSEFRPHREMAAAELSTPLPGAGAQPSRRAAQVQHFGTDRRLAAGLGWFSIGLGAFEMCAPRALARLIGLEPWRHDRDWLGRAGPIGARPASRFEHTSLLRALGAREIASGIGILSGSRPAPWLWSRVLGDAMDLSLLGLALASGRARQGRLIGASLAVLGVTALDVLSAQQFSRSRERAQAQAGERRSQRLALEASVIINRSPQECYEFWHELGNVPRFMKSIESVRPLDDKRSRWVARAPGGARLEWTSEIVQDAPNRLISWRSVDARIPNSGTVHFHPAHGKRGTLVRMRLQHELPRGAGLWRLGGGLLRKLPKMQVREDLRRLKQLLEVGEIVTTQGQAHGRRSLLARAFGGGMHP